LKAPEAKRLKLKRDETLSNVAFKFNLRRYTDKPVNAPAEELVDATSKVKAVAWAFARWSD